MFLRGDPRRWIRQPAAIAALVLSDASAHALLGHRQGTDSRGLTTPFVVALLVIGAGSAFYHASLSFAGQFVDVLGMYSWRHCVPASTWPDTVSP